MDDKWASIARMRERHAHFLQIELNTLHRDLSAKYEELVVLRKRAAELEAENVKLKRRIAEFDRTVFRRSRADGAAGVCEG